MSLSKVILASVATVLATGVGLVACVTNRGVYFLEASPEIAGVDRTASQTQLILPLEVNIAAAAAFVKLGFGLEPAIQFQSTSFVTPRLRTLQAQTLVALVKSYGDFEGEKVAEALSNFRGRVSAVEFGRAGSPILYIELPYWTHQLEENATSGPGQRISDEEAKALVAELREAFSVKLKAREFSEEKRRVRIWWY